MINLIIYNDTFHYHNAYVHRYHLKHILTKPDYVWLFIGSQIEGTERWRKRMARWTAKAHLFWYVLIFSILGFILMLFNWETNQISIVLFLLFTLYSGRVLKDEDTLEKSNVTEKGFIVCMLNKTAKKPVKKEAPASSEASKSDTKPEAATDSETTSKSETKPEATATNETTTSSSTNTSASEATTTTGSDTPAGDASSASFNDPSAFATGSARDIAISNMIEMGYPRDQVIAAMRAAFNNPDRAVEYLLTSIPEELQQRAAAPPAATATRSAASAGANPTSPGAAGDDEDDGAVDLFAAAAAQAANQTDRQGSNDIRALDALRRSAQFQQLREAAQQQPEMLEPMIHQLFANSPSLRRLVETNHEAFSSMLMEELGLTEMDDDAAMEGDDDLYDGAGAAGMEGEPPAGAHPDSVGGDPRRFQLQVTPEENEAITRLSELGFDRNLVIQAFFACDKNEELTANYLFDHGNEDD